MSAHKNIVVCLDGTNNRFGPQSSNVVSVFSLLSGDDQIGYYDPGVGTLRRHTVFRAPQRSLANLAGLAFGYGLIRNVEEAYRFLMKTYEVGDRIYLFGFSRGAYTARVLAGLVRMCGLLRQQHANLLPYALDLYRHDARRGEQTPEKDREFWKTVNEFKNTFAWDDCPIRFAGLWDTVSSVGWFRDPPTFRYTSRNPSIESYRHAIALDERRAFYRQNTLSPKRASDTRREAWFAGVHSDIGGTYSNDTKGLSRITLEWVLIGAYHAGLRFDHGKAIKAVEASPPLSHPEYTIHESLRGFWHLAEVLPKKTWQPDPNHPGQWRSVNRPNLWRRRTLRDDSAIHASVQDRISDEPPTYQPSNLDAVNTRTETWERLLTVLQSPPAYP